MSNCILLKPSPAISGTAHAQFAEGLHFNLEVQLCLDVRMCTIAVFFGCVAKCLSMKLLSTSHDSHLSNRYTLRNVRNVLLTHIPYSVTFYTVIMWL